MTTVYDLNLPDGAGKDAVIYEGYTLYRNGVVMGRNNRPMGSKNNIIVIFTQYGNIKINKNYLLSKIFKDEEYKYKKTKHFEYLDAHDKEYADYGKVRVYRNGKVERNGVEIKNKNNIVNISGQGCIALPLLIYKTFSGDKDPVVRVFFKNGDKSDMSLENLTPKRLKTYSPPRRFSKEEVEKIKEMNRAGLTLGDIAVYFNTCKSTVKSVVDGNYYDKHILNYIYIPCID